MNALEASLVGAGALICLLWLAAHASWLLALAALVLPGYGLAWAVERRRRAEFNAHAQRQIRLQRELDGLLRRQANGLRPN